MTYQYTELPTELLIKACKQYKGSGNTLSVYLTASREILQWPEGRQSLKKELALRYIGKQLSMKFQNVWKAIKTLVRDGYIEIVKLGKNGVGSIIKLILPSVDEQVIENITTSDEQVIKDITVNDKQVIENITTKITSSKTNKTITPEVVSSCTNDKKKTVNKDTSSIGSISTSSISKHQNSKENIKILTDNSAKNLKGGDELSKQKISMQINIPGITEKTLQIGIHKLKSRNIADIPFVLEEIKNQMEIQENIKSPKAYFLSLCKKMKNFSKTVIKTQAASTKTMETINSWKEEKENEEDPNLTFEKFARQNKEGMKKVVWEVDNRPDSRFASGITKIILYVAEFKKRFIKS